MVRVYSNRSWERRLGKNVISVLFINIWRYDDPKTSIQMFWLSVEFSSSASLLMEAATVSV